ncbi:MAG TPA: alpha-glucan family phosphorylase [Acidimicrobiales bacterium]|nr:alpha-glucan family phosphorylase [Acidimicrobiales bacterium]
MKAVVSFVVRARMPERLAPLEELARNLRWSWDDRSTELFRWIDPERWEASSHDPVRLLGLVPSARLEELSHDPSFLGFMREVSDELHRYLAAPGWFQDRAASPLQSVAYFSPEFGIAEALPQYSGGLGVLAGDHLKAASGLGVPLVGVGLLYRHAYFHQELDADGWQLERYPTLDPHTMPLELVGDVRIEVDLAGRRLCAQVWRAHVGRVSLYLLDADVDDNDEELRQVTDRLYGGDHEHRLRQEILLGMGGVRALDALGEAPQLFHMNEGHAGFCTLERIRALCARPGPGLSVPEAVETVRASTVFTTHTPVPAGIDRFDRALMERYFSAWAADVGISIDELMALGHDPGDPPHAPFNMAVLGLRLSGAANAVSKLHGAVSRRMFGTLWPDVPTDEVPIGSVTNGVHPRTWVSQEMNELLERRVLPEWPEASADRWERIADAPSEELWRVRTIGRERLVGFVRARLRASAAARGETDTGWIDHAFDPAALTIGWARRFATYKRATLLLAQPERLRRLLRDTERPVQLVFAGKAHPADDRGKEMIRAIVQASRDAELRTRMVFLEDYDMALARMLYQGVDLWLNTPRRPQEACGTSGMKAALNGVLNCSVLDGWFDELYDGDNGWAIPSAEWHGDLARRDEVEGSALFDLLENEIVPAFYDRRGHGGAPGRWIERMTKSLSSLGPAVSASRMVRDYVFGIYEPLAERATALSSGDHRRARALAAWKERTVAAWPGVRITGVETDDAPTELGATRKVVAQVTLGTLEADDVAVQLLHGPVGPDGELERARVVTMQPSGGTEFWGELTCDAAGRYGFTVRVVPSHADLATFADVGVVTWVEG